MTEYTGKILRVDMDKEKMERVTVDEKVLRKFIGGTSLGAKFLYDEVPPGTEWSDPENILIIAAGPLNGTPMGGSGSISIVTKGPLTNGAGCCQTNGYFGAYLRLCGLNGIIVKGKAQNLKYLYLDSESEELKDADWLAGMDTYKTADLVKHEHGCKERDMAVVSIGPAGENLVKFAGVFVDYGHSASHNGLGAVMGSKKLKAIGVRRGKQQVPIKDVNRVREISKELIESVKKQATWQYEYGTLSLMHRIASGNRLPVKNYTTSTWKIDEGKWQKFGAEYIREKYSVRRNSCWGCQIHHCDIMKITDGPYAGELLEEPEYEQIAAWSSAIGQEDITAALMLSKEVDRLGMDTNESGWVVGFAMECFERGILTKEKANGLDLSWGNPESARLLLNLIAKRQGIGDILAEGVMRTSKKMGGDAVNYAVHTMKGNTPRSHDHRNGPAEMFDTSISNTGTLETAGGPTTVSENPTWEEIVNANIHNKGAMILEDSMVTCRFNTRTNVQLLCQALSAVTGWDFSWEEGMQVGLRAVNLLRAFNIRHGINSREIDRPSPRYGSAPDAGPWKGRNLLNVWDKMLDAYYSGMGWDKSGVPLPETLEKLGLEDVSKDLHSKSHK